MHKRPGPACCENARYGSATSPQRDRPDKGRLWVSRALEPRLNEAQECLFFSARGWTAQNCYPCLDHTVTYVLTMFCYLCLDLAPSRMTQGGSRAFCVCRLVM